MTASSIGYEELYRSEEGLEYIEIAGKNGELFYKTLRNAVEASRILMTKYNRKVLAVPIERILDLEYDIFVESVYIKLRKKIYRRNSPPPIDWFINKILSYVEDEKTEEEPDIITMKEDRDILAGQEALSYLTLYERSS